MYLQLIITAESKNYRKLTSFLLHKGIKTNYRIFLCKDKRQLQTTLLISLARQNKKNQTYI